MSRIPVRELRNDVSAILRRVEQGESFEVTVRGRPVAALGPLSSRPRTIPTAILAAALDKVSADAGLADDLAEALPDTTDDVA